MGADLPPPPSIAAAAAKSAAAADSRRRRWESCKLPRSPHSRRCPSGGRETAPWETAPMWRPPRGRPPHLKITVAGVGSQRVWKPLLPPLKQTCSLQPPPPSTAGARGLAAQQELINHHLQQQEAAAPDAALPGDQLSADQSWNFLNCCIISLPTLCYI